MQATAFFATIALAGSALAAAPSAYITVEASHGGAGNGLTNNTIIVPIDTTYTNPDALAAVSTLYLVGASAGVPVDSITCTPFQSTDGTGTHGLAFTSTTPSRLSTNTVQVGSIVCHTA
ncbi:hypothetical protein F5Y13DRAFT_194974 [Hypoxylon sp. FL1857]|nr:hypothetical protein F5Y13DRAFT_194974 [Hypoxylon sp. FL1857]